MSSWKGKEKVVGGKDDKTGGRKRKDRSNVLQFFDDTAFELDGDDESSDDEFGIDDFLENEFENDVISNNQPAKEPVLPFIKEEEMDHDELERMVVERYGPGSSFVTYAEDGYESKRSTDRVSYPSSSSDPTLWKVKCVVGRERHSTFCLMQKFADLQSLGTKLQIISAFTLDHVKGSIYIEADKQNDVYEACKGLTNIYSSRTVPVPRNEISHVLSVRSKSHGITEGMWARVKNGKYKGDLAQVVAVNDTRKKVTVKLIPRIDLRALADKFGGGVSAKRASTPAPRLISASELEEFRPLIQVRRDRDTNQMFQILDGMLLKDGYLFKKVSIDSLGLWGVMPTEDELLKFEPSNYDESNDLEWLSDLYGDRKKKRVVMSDKGAGKGKGKGASSSNVENNFEVHDLVFFGRKDFGVIIGTEKDDFKIMKEGSEGPLVVTLPSRELKSASFDKKLFTALDKHMKSISINGKVRVLDGPLKDREGIVKQIYRGTIFLYNESEEENNGYLCIKSQKCEKVISPIEVSESGPSGFGDFSSSPKSPLSPKKSWQGRENGNFNREDKDGMFTVGQSVRIRIGPLKGYLCRVLAIRRSDVTVKLDSKPKIVTVKMENLSEVRGKNSAATLGEDQETVKPFELLGTADGSGDWMAGAGTAVESGGWNIGGSSTEGTSNWSALPASSQSQQPNSGTVPSSTVDGDAEKGDSAWSVKPPSSHNQAWGTAGVDEKNATDAAQGDGWNKAASTSGTSDSWGKAVESCQNSGQGTSWGRDGENSSKKDDSSLNKAAWNSSEPALEKQSGTWGNAGQPEASGWKKPTGVDENQTQSFANKKNDATGGGNDGSSWGKTAVSQDDRQGGSSWGKQDGGSSLNKNESGSSWSKPAGGSSWGQQADTDAKDPKDTNARNDNGGKQDGGSSWNKNEGGSSWNNKQGGGSSWSKPADAIAEESQGARDWSNKGGKQEGGSSWSKQDGGSSWNNKQAGGSSWGQKAELNANASKGGTDQNDSWGKQEGGSSWSKPAGGSSWGQKTEGNANASKGGTDQSDSWGKQDNGSSWSKPAGGSSWGQQANVTAEDHSKGKSNQNDSWSKNGGGSSWNNQAGSSGNAPKPSGGAPPSEWTKGSGTNDETSGGSGWGGKNTSGGGSSSGWGQSTRWNSDVESAGGNQDQTDNSYRGRGRGGSWRGGRGGRGESDRSGFGGGGDSEQGGFGGRDGSDRGGFRGRGGSERGGFRGRGRSDRGGFRGRGRSDEGGFGGRGRGRSDQYGDWNKRNDFGEDKPQSWSKSSSSADAGGNNENRGSWNQGGGDGGKWKSWSSGGDENNATRGSWKSTDGGGNNENKGSWNQGAGDGGKWKSWGSGGSQSKGDTEGGGNAEAGGSGQENSWKTNSAGGWNDQKPGGSGSASGTWNKPSGSDGGQAKEGFGAAEGEGPADSWGKATTSSWGKAKDGGW